MGTVTIRNYHFPITFSHKGWSVKIDEDTSFFKMKDLKVKVRIDVSAESFAHSLAYTYAQIKQSQAGNNVYSFLTSAEREKIYTDAYNEAHSRYLRLAKDFADRKGVVEYSFSVNGNLSDRFFGQNISAAEKACKKVVEYIDNNLGDAWKEFVSSVK